LDVKVVSPGKAYVPAGFGEGSLWTTVSEPSDPSAACDDVNVKTVGSASASSEALCAAEPATTLLKRVDPRTGEVVAEIPLERRLSNLDLFTQVAFGAGSVWVSSGYYDIGPAMERQPGDVVLRIDPRTNQIVDRIPVDPPSGLAFGHGSVWATSAGYGTVSRIEPQTGEVVAKIEVGRGAVDITADESSGAMWVASVFLPKDYGGYDLPEYSGDRNLTRVDPTTNRVVAEIPIRAGSPTGGAQNVAVGEGAVWVQSGDGKLFKVDPATNEVIAMVSVGDSTCVGPTCVGPSSALAVYGGAVWAMVQASASPGTRLVRVDPRTEQVVAEDIGPISKVEIGFVAAGGGYVWFSSGEGLARVAP
jgi:streptogramin lyase